MRSSVHIAVRRLLGLLLLAPIFVAVGCGGGIGDVSGTVSYKGKPLDGGQIQYQSGGKVVAAQIGSDGKYTVPGVQAGNAKVAVSYIDPKVTEHFRAVSSGSRAQAGAGRTGTAPGAAGEGANPAAAVDPNRFSKIPDKYSDFNSSELTFDVKPGMNTNNVDLK